MDRAGTDAACIGTDPGSVRTDPVCVRTDPVPSDLACVRADTMSARAEPVCVRVGAGCEGWATVLELEGPLEESRGVVRDGGGGLEEESCEG